MANLASIGRPYALAAFQYAKEKSILSEWKMFFKIRAELASHASVKKLMANPQTASKDLLSLFESVLTNTTPAQKNFLQLLSENKRLSFLPAIADSFNAHCAQLEEVVHARVVTAVSVDDAFKNKLASALTKRVKHEVMLTSEIDPTILGGAIIHLGDKVIDGSVRGKLARLLEFSLR